MTRMNVGVLDSLLERRPINLGYIILTHMLSTLEVNNGLLPYGSIIYKILCNFRVPIQDSIYMETKKIGDKVITCIRFYKKNREWIKTPTSKNQDTLVALEDDRVLNDIYPPDQLPDFRLGVRLHLHVKDRYHNFQQNSILRSKRWILISPQL